MKKIVLVLLSIFILACDTTPKKSNSLIDYIPKDALIIFKINNLEQAKSSLRDNNFIKNNTSLELFEYFKRLPITNKINDSNGLLCFSSVGKSDLEYTYICKFDPKLIKIDSLKQNKIETINYSEKIINKITSGKNTFFTVQEDSLLISSSSQLLIENAIRQQKNITPIPEDLKKAFEISSSDNPFSLLINGKKLQNILDSLLPDSYLSVLSKFSNWISLDATIEQNGIHLDGIAIEKDSIPSTINVFNNTIAQENRIANITPITAKGLISFTYDDFDILKKNLAIYQNRKLENIPMYMDEIFSGITEIGLIYLSNDTALSLTTIDPETVTKSLAGEKVNNYRGVTIYRYENFSSFSQILSPLVNKIEAKYYIVYDDFIIFASSIDSLQTIVANILNKTVLQELEYYKNTMAKLSNESSILIVGSTDAIKDYVSKNVSKEYKKQWNDLKYKDHHMAALQIIKENNFAHIHASFQKNIAKGSATSVTQVASTTLDNKILNEPILVKNHKTNGMDIVVQDINNILYLISNTGTIFWKKQIDGAILGDIKQIDIYKNGRYQLLFCTTNTVYLLDRNGKNVSPYPKKFNQSITQPIALFDYDQNKHYRYVITQNNSVKMFNSVGNLVTGFGFNGTETAITLPPKHIRIGPKDYILIAEENGKLNILDRLGRTRINLKNKINFSTNEWYQYLEKFISTSKDGKLIEIDTNGKVFFKDLNLNENSRIISTNKSLVSFTDNRLTIKDKTVELDFGIYSNPKLFYINNKVYITITDFQSNKVYLFDSNADLFPNFPVYGNSVMSLGDIDKDPNLEFVVQGEENNILIYHIN